MMITRLLGAIALALALGACDKDAANSEDIEAFVKLDSEKAAAFAAGGDDCRVKAQSAGEWRRTRAAEYEALRAKLTKQWPGGPPKAVRDKHGETLEANKQAVIDATFACTNHEEFDKMMEETMAR